MEIITSFISYLFNEKPIDNGKTASEILTELASKKCDNYYIELSKYMKKGYITVTTEYYNTVESDIKKEHNFSEPDLRTKVYYKGGNMYNIYWTNISNPRYEFIDEEKEINVTETNSYVSQFIIPDLKIINVYQEDFYLDDIEILITKTQYYQIIKYTIYYHTDDSDKDSVTFSVYNMEL